VDSDELSNFVKKVIFKLHPSFDNYLRVVETNPFEITETGWGEFEIAIKLFFQDPNEPPIELFHPLKLYPPEDTNLSTKKAVVSEHYDEIIFSTPSDSFYKKLTAGDPNLKHYSEQAEIRKLLDAHSKVKIEILRLTERIEELKNFVQSNQPSNPVE